MQQKVRGATKAHIKNVRLGFATDFDSCVFFYINIFPVFGIISTFAQNKSSTNMEIHYGTKQRHKAHSSRHTD